MDFLDPRLSKIEEKLTKVLEHLDIVKLEDRVADLEEGREKPLERHQPAFYDSHYPNSNPYHVSPAGGCSSIEES